MAKVYAQILVNHLSSESVSTDKLDMTLKVLTEWLNSDSNKFLINTWWQQRYVGVYIIRQDPVAQN